MTLEEKFERAYKQVFTADNKVKNCGRAACAKLIEAAVELDADIDYGNLRTGCMSIENIIALHERVIGK